MDNSEDISGYSRQALSLDSVQEVQVLVTGFKAEYGQASGGVINVITRSGTNDLRGSGFFLFRDQSLMARSPYASRSLAADPFQRVHYGGWVGGPIRQNRLHFFANYEREDRDTNTASTRTLPASTAAFSAATLKFLGDHGIPLSLFGGGGTTRHVRPEFVDIHNVTAKVDGQLSGNQSLTLRYQLTHDNEPSGESGTLLDYNGNYAFFRTNYANANHKWVMAGMQTGFFFIREDVQERVQNLFTTLPADDRSMYGTPVTEERRKTLSTAAAYESRGSHDIPARVSMDAAIDFHNRLSREAVEARDRYLAQKVHQGLRAIDGVDVLTSDSPELGCALVAFRVKGVPTKELNQLMWDRYDIYIRSVTHEEVDWDANRVSLHVMVSGEQVDRFLGAIEEVAAEARAKG